MNDGEGTSRSGCRTEGWKIRPGENCFEPSSKYIDKDQFFMSDDRFELLLGNILLGVSNNSGNEGLVGEILSPHGDQEDGVANGYEDEDDTDDGVLEKDRFAEQTSVNDDDFEDPKVGEENMNQGAETIRTEIIEFHGDRDVEVGGDDMNEDLVYVGLHSRPCSDDDDDEAREVYPDYHPAVGMELPVFEVSMKFGSRAQFREAVKTTKILTGRPVKVTYNDNRRMRAKCDGYECPWSLHAKRINKIGNPNFVLTTMNLEHGLMCEESFEKTKISAKWLADKFQERFRCNTTMPLRQIRHEVDATFQCEISQSKAYLARKIAVEKIQGNAVLQYAQLWNYVEELKRTQPGSTFDIKFENFREDGRNNKFQRFYCCFGAMKEGFLRGCRPIIFLDGCFLTGLYKGQLLTAIGVDGNNGYWPIAWAVVEKECRETWIWFLKLLVADLEIATESCYFTVMSDQQKGLGCAIAHVLPRADRRFCVQHLYSNFKKKHPGQELKDHLWRIASSTTVELFEVNMEALKVFDLEAYKWILKSLPRKTWVKAFFSTHVKCDTLVNNMCESFNSKILKAREKSIITMLEDIRRYVMERIKIRGELSSKYGGSICAAIKTIIQERSEFARGWQAISNGDGGYEVHNPTKGQFVVVLNEKTCTCRLWQLSGIPCCHAIPCIRKNSENPLAYIDNCYSKTKFMELYRHFLMPINGYQMWPKSPMFELDPPRYVPQTGRPKKTRFEGVEIITDDAGVQRLKRRNVIHCGTCGEIGHNCLTCKAPVDANGICRTHDMDRSAPREERTQQTSQDEHMFQEPANNDNHDVIGLDQNREQQMDKKPATDVQNEHASTHVTKTGKRKKGRPKGSKNKPKTTPNSLAPSPSTVVGSSSGTNKRKGPPNSLVKNTLSDKIAHNMNCEFLGEPAPYKIGRWATPKRRARLS